MTQTTVDAFFRSPVHPTAVVASGARIGADCTIGPFCVVGSNVVLDAGVTLTSHVVVEGHTRIGAGTIIYPFAVIGTAPQDLKYAGEASRLVIGRNTVIREHVTMNPGTQSGGMETRVGDNCLLMIACHIAHDCQIEDKVIIANNTSLGGHVRIGEGAIIGGHCALHQFVRVGRGAIVGGGSFVESDVIPYGRVKGERASLAGLNLIGLERRGFDKTRVRGMQKAYDFLFGKKATGTLDHRLKQAAADFGEEESVVAILDFIVQGGDRPLCQPATRT